jgi:hypothetical protein
MLTLWSLVLLSMNQLTEFNGSHVQGSPTVTNDTSFRVTLSNPTGGAVLGTASTFVNIMNAPEPGTFRTVAPPFDTALNFRREGDVNILTWDGGGQLQRADRPTGPWQTLSIATNPFTVQSPIPTTFYRVTRPRPANVYVPSSYDGQTPLPLVMLLHAYTRTGAAEEAYMQFRPPRRGSDFFTATRIVSPSMAQPWPSRAGASSDLFCPFPEGRGLDGALETGSGRP